MSLWKLMINEVIKNKDRLNKFIAENFESIAPSEQNPIFPFKTNYKSKIKAITFCNITPIDSWVLKEDTSYTFFLLLKNNENVFNAITKTYGHHTVEAEAEVNNVNMGISYSWDKPTVEIHLRKFINDEDYPKYEDCYMVVVGNMMYKDIVILPDTTGLDLDEL